MENKSTIIFINDAALLNQRYRQPLIDGLSNQGHPVLSLGLFDTKASFLKTLFYMITHYRNTFVSSNLRANLVSLSIFWLQGLVILNGLGRYRNKRWLRRVLILLFRMNFRKRVAIQSYADFRYFRRYAPKREFVWIPGSGGQIRKLGPQGPIVTVQRDDKLPMVASSLIELIKDNRPNCPLIVVGCKDGQAVADLLGNTSHFSTGYLQADEILSGGKTFIQPSGYGEGFPHSLADAIVSGMEIIIAPIEYRRYGLYRLNTSPTKQTGIYRCFKPTEPLRYELSIKNITEKYASLILS
ncbi:MAG: hypothetical protein AB8G77_27510 [Rhodothermales bacterium]